MVRQYLSVWLWAEGSIPATLTTLCPIPSDGPANTDLEIQSRRYLYWRANNWVWKDFETTNLALLRFLGRSYRDGTSWLVLSSGFSTIVRSIEFSFFFFLFLPTTAKFIFIASKYSPGGLMIIFNVGIITSH